MTIKITYAEAIELGNNFVSSEDWLNFMAALNDIVDSRPISVVQPQMTHQEALQAVQKLRTANAMQAATIAALQGNNQRQATTIVMLQHRAKEAA